MDFTPYYDVLRSTSLLRGMRDDELDGLLGCMAPRTRRYQKGEFLLLAGYANKDVGILLQGRVTALKNTVDGASVAITRMAAGGLFGDVLSGSSERSPVSVMAETDCLAMFFPYQKIIRPCAHLHETHLQLMQNLVLTISNKYFALDRRVDLLICKSLRARISLWLLDEAEKNASDTFTVPLTRAALAEYLNCDRSALSRELGRMQSENLIETYRGSFKILDKERLRAQNQTTERSLH